MPQEFQSSVRVYKYPFELIMKVTNKGSTAFRRIFNNWVWEKWLIRGRVSIESHIVSELVSRNTRLQQKNEGGVGKIDKAPKNQFFPRQ